MDVDRTKLGLFVRRAFAHIICVIGRPRTRRDKIIVIRTVPHDGVFRPRGARGRQRIGQVDAPHRWQLIRREPVQERRRPRPAHDVLGKGGRINQPGCAAQRLGLGLGILPPRAAPERPAVMVEIRISPHWPIIIRPFPAVHLPHLRAQRDLAVVNRSSPQRPGGGAFLIRVVQNEDVVVAFLILSRRIFGGDPRPEAFRVQRRHVNLGLAVHHHLRQIIPGAARRCDAE